MAAETAGEVGEDGAGGGAAAPDRWRTQARTTVRRKPERGRYDQETIEAVLDEAFVCHVGFCTEEGPVVIPTAYARMGDVIYLHGAPANYALKTMGVGAPVSLAVTLVDGLVLARSGFHHSINYRSVVVYGHAHEVHTEAEKRRALDAVVEHIVPGRTADARGPSESEVRATRVVRVTMDEVSAKVRTGGPIDDEEDVAAGGIWAGHIPLAMVAGQPVRDAASTEGIPVPEYASRYRRPQRA